MDGYDSMFGADVPLDAEAKGKLERRVSQAEDTLAYVVTPVPDDPENPASDPKVKRDKKADPRMGDKLLRFIQPWDWKLAKVEDKPLKFPVITDIVSLDRVGWKAVRNAAIGIGAVASSANLILVTIFACAIASQSKFGLLADSPGWISGPIWFVLMIVATVIAGVLQLATDFGLPWASGLAFEKYKISPTAIIVLWLFIFMPTTFIMKFDLYQSWAHERQAEIVQKQTEDTNDSRVLGKFASGPPPGIEASEAIITQSPGLLKDMRDERDRLVSARDQEKKYLGSTENGMGPKWLGLNTQVEDINKRIEAQASSATAAATSLQDRKDYDAAKLRQEGNAKITANGGSVLSLWYDIPFVIVLRVLGGEFVSIVAIIVAFVALKKTEEHKEAEEAKREASERAKKGWNTRRYGPKDAEFEEAAPINAPKIENQGPVAPGATAKADTNTMRVSDPNTHPDASGDDYGAKTNGHGEDLTTGEADQADDSGDENADDAGQPAG